MVPVQTASISSFPTGNWMKFERNQTLPASLPTYLAMAVSRSKTTSWKTISRLIGMVVIAWATDTGGDPNLFAHWRAFDLDGTPRSGDGTLAPRSGGASVAASAWMVQLARRGGDGWLLAGTWASPTVQRFQVFAQAIDPAGAATGPFLTAPDEAEVSANDPAVAVGADGTPWLAWTRTPDQGALRAEYAAVTGEPPAVGAPTAATATDNIALSSQLPALAASPLADGPVWLTFTRQRAGLGGAELDVVLRELPSGVDGPALEAGAEDEVDYAPALAADPDGDGGLLVWFRTRSGIYNDVWAQRFRAGDEGPTADGEPLLLNPPDEAADHAAISVYGAGITALPGDVWVVVWVEGRNPDFDVRARFLGF